MSISSPGYCSALGQPDVIKERVKEKIPLACGQLSAVGSPAPNPGGPSQIPGSSPWSPPPWAYRPPASRRNPGCSSHNGCGCLVHMRHNPSLPRQSRAVAADRGCVRIDSCSCGAPRRMHQAGCSRSNTGETGNDSASRIEAYTREDNKTEERGEK